MKPTDKHLELKVGLFVLIGLVVLGWMVIQFGRFGQGLQGTYTIAVRFPDASGLTKGAEVLMSGARIGRVAEDPRLLPDSDGVVVYLNIGNSYLIPKGAVFRVGSSGLLGDRYVQVIRGTGPQVTATFLKPGDEVSGTREPGLDDFVRNSEQILEEARGLVNSLQTAVDKVNTKALSEENLVTVSDALKSFGEAAKNLAEVTKRVDGLVSNLSKASDDLKNAAEGASRIIDQAQTSGGLLQTLTSDRGLAEDFRAFVSNVRARGLLFYRDRPVPEPTRSR